MHSTEHRQAPVAAEAFGELLRQHRLAAGLTQESLAERAGLSMHGIQKLERGASHPHRDTLERLIAALQLAAIDEAHFKTVARPAPRRRQPPRAAPAASTEPTRHNLPIPTTSFIARAEEIVRITQRLRESRLLMITGSGGCGKTRLAVEVARELVGEFADGVWLVELAPLFDASLVPQTIATTLGIQDVPGRPVADVLTEYLRSRRALLVLDNCEHLIDACAQVVDRLLRSCAHLQIVATSRELLGVGGEATWRVTSLSLVNPEGLAPSGADPVAAILASEAARLFLDRARLMVPSFEVSAHNAPAIAQLCRRLDGLPLAIELAAARLTTLSVEQIATRLDQRFRLLTGGNRTAIRRQQTLQATIDWSYQLLSEEERALVRSLAVFAGGWSLEAAESLGADAVGPHGDVLDLLSRLVAKSMVLVEEPLESEPSVVRYRFLETIRQYAEEKLVEAGHAAVLRTRHRDWYLSLAEQALDGMEGADQKRWWDHLDVEHDNLRVALTWTATDPNGPHELLRFAGMLGRFWQIHGYLHEGIGWLELALVRNEPTPSAARARALNWLGQLEAINGNLERARPPLEESIAHARAVGDRRVLSMALRHLGLAVQTIGEYAQSRKMIDEALAVSRETGYKREIAWNLQALGQNLADTGRRDGIAPLLLEGIALGRESGDVTPVLASMWTLGRLYGLEGEFQRARRQLDGALRLARQIDYKVLIPGLLVTLGDLASAEREWATAVDFYRQGLGGAHRMAARGAVANGLRHYAAMCGARGDHRAAVRILGATSTVHDAPGTTMVMASLRAGEEAEVVAAAQRALGDEDFATAWTEGQSITLEQVTAEVLSDNSEVG